MDPIAFAKSAVKFVITVGVSKIVNDIIEKNVDTETLPSKVSVKMASIGIGGAVSMAAGDFTDKQIDDLVTLYKKIKNGKNTPESED